MSNVHSTDEYQSGDLILFGHGSRASSHVAIYAVDTKGKGHVVQASYCSEYGIVKDTGGITSNYWATIRVFRNKGNKINGMAQCDSCATAAKEDGGIEGLQDGGFTSLEAAREFMKPYREEAKKKSRKNNIYFQGAKVMYGGSPCSQGTLNNCSAFSEWFVNRYTTAGPDQPVIQGSQFVKYLLDQNLGFKDGEKVPRAYAVVSMGPQTGSADGWFNHTGIVLGIDKERNKIIIGEASCGNGFTDRYPNANEYDLDKYTNGSSQYAPKYAYTDDILKEVK